MGTRRLSSAVFILLIVATAAWPGSATAQAVRMDEAELARASSVIVTGRVVGMSTARDGAGGYIYTYVTIDVDQRIKGAFADSQVVVKQLGGVVDNIEMVVYDQAEFSLGEEVLLFLSERPRDNTLTTSGLWQGKWTISRDPSGGAGLAMRSPFRARDDVGMVGSGAFDDVRVLDPFLAELRAWSGGDQAVRAGARVSFNVRPVETPRTGISIGGGPIKEDDPFTLLGPGRWHEADDGTPVQVDIQDGGEPGLSGGGFAEIAAARGLWNAVGSSLNLAAGNTVLAGANRATVCSATDFKGVQDGLMTLYFDDPCEEIGTGGTIAIGGFWRYSAGDPNEVLKTVNGTVFSKIEEGYIIMQGGPVDEPATQNYLNTSQCFLDIATHEIGHAFGAGHSDVDSSNIMWPVIDDDCLTAPSLPLTGALGADDVDLIDFIYPAAPLAPTGLALTIDAPGQVTLDWTDNAVNESQYQVWRKLATDSGYTKIATLSADAESYSDSTVVGGNKYCYRVRAKNNAGPSAYTSVQCSTVGSPDAPDAMDAVVLSGTSVKAKWSDNSDNESNFELYRKLEGGNWALIVEPAAGTSKYTDAGLTNGATYCYRVRAENGAGFSDYSDQRCITVDVPAKPTQMLAVAPSSNQVDVTWKDKSDNETIYKLYRRVDGGPWVKITNLPKDTVMYTDNTVSAGSQYCYRVRAKNTLGHGDYAAKSCVTPA